MSASPPILTLLKGLYARSFTGVTMAVLVNFAVG